MSSPSTVIGVLRRFLPEYLKSDPPISQQQQRAIWAITHCRTAMLGGKVFECQRCAKAHFAYHSCNHKACPQCGRDSTQKWIHRELGKLVNAPYFLVTFTLPEELRPCFFGSAAKQAFDTFFVAVSGALSEKLATDKGLRAQVNGFTGVLHTWNQKLGFHPHIHCLVPGAGLDAKDHPVRVKDPKWLVYVEHLQAAFRQHMRRLLENNNWQVDPEVWRKNWGVHIQPSGSGVSALKYLGTYVSRTAISDERIVAVDESHVTFRWKDRDLNLWRKSTVSGVEFVRRYLRHVLPKGLRSVRYYGFCHPSAKANRLRVQFHTGMAVHLGATIPEPTSTSANRCPVCGGASSLLFFIPPGYKARPPPTRNRPNRAPRSAQPISIAA